MELSELKEILTNSDKEFQDKLQFIFCFQEDDFLCVQYSKALAAKENLQIRWLEDLSELEQSSEFDSFGSLGELLIFRTSEELDLKNINSENNFIIICKKCDKNINGPQIFNFPKLTEWQIESYVKNKLQGLSEEQCKKLCTLTKYNIHRLDLECQKLEMFNSAFQEIVFNEMLRDNSFGDMSDLSIFTLSNALIKHDLSTINQVLLNINYIDIEAVGLVTILKRNIKNIIDIKMNPKANANELGINPKQFAAIKYNSGKFSNDQLISIFEFLVNIDNRLKNGNLQFSNNSKENNVLFTNYIVNNFLVRSIQ